jgi:putative transposase
MREDGLRDAYLRKGRKGGSTKQNPRHTAAPDLLERDYRRGGAQHQVGRGPDANPHRRGSGALWLAWV